MTIRPAPDEASEVQRRAADPATSPWLTANAGSGKTRVLTDRVARLLIDGVDPQSILCLTYTKAAAGEMQNRLFHRLGEWAMKDDVALGEALAALGLETGLPPERLARARTLFAQAIETPGGLKIQTIHAFCAGLLRRFPLEAGVSPRFVEIDEPAARRLRVEIVEDLAESRPELVDGLARFVTGESLDKLAEEIAGERESFAEPLDGAAARALFDVPRDLTREGLAAWVAGGTGPLLRQIAEGLAAGSNGDLKALTCLEELDFDRVRFGDLQALEGVFLYGEKAKEPFGSKRGKFPTKATRDRLAPVSAELDAFMDRVEEGRRLRTGLLCAERTEALHRFAAAFLPQYAARKAERGWVDFADLIGKARDLLSNRDLADWVLFRLDGGLDHILVDEAQDTSPSQWAVIERLTAEFAAGAETRGGRQRTVFVVGDRKQSIYSFQGADPVAFDAMRERLGRQRGEALATLEMRHSFRSSPAILRAVDAVFEGEAGSGLGVSPGHEAFHGALPGRVDLWPAIPKPEKEDDDQPWWEPLDRTAPDAPGPRLARQIAVWIRERIAAGETVPLKDGTRKPFEAGDVVVLVQRRSPLFHEVIRACKAEGLRIAGADRLRLEAELAVRDLNALLSFLALSEDSLSLAAALRSPLFGWSEGALHDLAAGRPKREYLWQALRRRADDHPETMEVLRDLRREADFLRPYDLLERILVRHDGRRRLLARLGPEAEDGIDALLAEALAYEAAEVPSLTGFLAWFAAEEVEAKRQLGEAGGRIRVMTIHGAKGLESPVVILPDTAQPPQIGRGEVLRTRDGRPIWKAPRRDRHPNLDAICQADRQAGEDELARLLYVAMTRAEVWLIVGAAGDVAARHWYPQIAGALERIGAAPVETPTGTGLRYAFGDWNGGPLAREAVRPADPAPLPPWAWCPAPAGTAARTTLSPSDLGGAKVVAGEGMDGGLPAELATRRGTHLHLLLEHLPGAPAAERRDMALSLLAAAPEPAGEEEADALLTEVKALLDAPALAPLFASDALAEVAVTGEVPGLGRVSGAIDRLVVGPDRVLAVDFKSNAVVPARTEDVPEGLLRQMGAYAHLLSAVYDREVEVAILWTRTGSLMPLPPEILRDALARAAKS